MELELNRKTKKTDIKRSLSLKEDFMHWSVDDRLYGALLHLATYHPEKQVLYVTKQSVNKNRDTLKKYCASEGQEIKQDKFRRLLQKMVDRGLMQETTLFIKKKETPVYTFLNPTDDFQPVFDEMLWYLVCTRNRHCIKIYIYLLNKYLWKKATEDNYIFTKKELYATLGYKKTNPEKLIAELVSSILESFKNEGIFNYEKITEEYCLPNGSIVPVHKYKLLFVAQKKEEFTKEQKTL